MRSIAVVIDGSENDAASLKTAVSFAQAADAQLSVYHNRAPVLLTAASFDMAIATYDNSSEVDERLDAAKAAFDAEARDYAGCRFVDMEAGPAHVLEMAAPYHDVLMLERLSDTEGPNAVALNSALWDIGSPVVVMPPEPRTGPIRNVVMSWNGTLQSGRALRAALPLIRKAESFTVLSREGSETDAELESYLSAWNIPVAQWKSYGDRSLSARGWARSLLAQVNEMHADLLVMGAFGGTLGSLLGFGRATEKVATSAKILVLFSA
ncbi:MAG: universal stress protein [Rhodospirillales bacterium]|nr:universal stress protein [Rhodospirillales bacterium]